MATREREERERKRRERRERRETTFIHIFFIVAKFTGVIFDTTTAALYGIGYTTGQNVDLFKINTATGNIQSADTPKKEN